MQYCCKRLYDWYSLPEVRKGICSFPEESTLLQESWENFRWSGLWKWKALRFRKQQDQVVLKTLKRLFLGDKKILRHETEKEFGHSLLYVAQYAKKARAIFTKTYQNVLPILHQVNICLINYENFYRWEKVKIPLLLSLCSNNCSQTKGRGNDDIRRVKWCI